MALLQQLQSHHHHHLPLLLLLSLLLTLKPQLSMCRPMIGLKATDDDAAVDPGRNIVLPRSHTLLMATPSSATEHTTPTPPRPPCNMASQEAAQKALLEERYKALLLNVLPRGTKVPPSGPSTGTNDHNS